MKGDKKRKKSIKDFVFHIVIAIVPEFGAKELWTTALCCYEDTPECSSHGNGEATLGKATGVLKQVSW